MTDTPAVISRENFQFNYGVNGAGEYRNSPANKDRIDLNDMKNLFEDMVRNNLVPGDADVINQMRSALSEI